MSRVAVVGAGLSGLFAATVLARRGHTVTLITKGLGGLQLSQGTIDVLGYCGTNTPVSDPLAAIAQLPATHPYATAGADDLVAAVAQLQQLLGCGADDACSLSGELTTNQMLPTAVGAWRPTALVPRSMIAGVPSPGKRYVVVGIRQLKDFHAQLIAGNLVRTDLGERGPIEARWVNLDFPARAGEVDSSPVTYARAFDASEFRQRFASALRAVIEPGEVVALPAVLGLHDPQAFAELSGLVGAELCEIVMQPPSVPGMRLNQALTAAAKAARVRIVLGSPVTGVACQPDAQRVSAVRVAVAGREREIGCDQVVFAPGGFESGALTLDSYNDVSETTLGLPLHGLAPIDELVHADYWGREQPLFRVGVRTDEQMRPIGTDGSVVYTNLHAAGSILAGSIRWQEKSGEGIALASAWRAVQAIDGEGS